MHRKMRAAAAALTVFLILIFLSAYSYQKSNDFVESFPSYGNAERVECMIYENSRPVYAEDCMWPQRETKTDGEQQPKGRFSKISLLYIFILAFTMGLLWRYYIKEKEFFASRQSYWFPMARFLCDLITQEKKDGKKECPVM